MEIMYWITRLEAINTMFGVIMIISIFGTLGFIAANIISVAAEFDDARECAKNVRKRLIAFVVILPISVIGLVFVPTTNDALIIYGVGGTLEWVRDNDNVKQIPDKAVEALSLYLDNINADLKEGNCCTAKTKCEAVSEHETNNEE